MKYTLVSTRNVQRILAAATALEARLGDDEIMGIGLVFGHPGLGKTMTCRHYHASSARDGRIRTVQVRALAIWTEASMLKDLLLGLGQQPRQYRKDIMWDQLCEALQSPAVFVLDEIDSIAESRRLIAVLKDLHDVTGSAILMIGEERVESLLRRYQAFWNRLNTSALVSATVHGVDDVVQVIRQRCEVDVDDDVCAEIHRTSGRSMRSVIDRIREMERFCRTNNSRRVRMEDYRKAVGGAKPVRRVGKRPAGKAAAAGGTNG